MTVLIAADLLLAKTSQVNRIASQEAAVLVLRRSRAAAIACRRLSWMPAAYCWSNRQQLVDPAARLAQVIPQPPKCPQDPEQGRQPQPVVLRPGAQQHLRHRQAHQFGVGQLLRMATPTLARGDHMVVDQHVQCRQEGVEVCSHERPSMPSSLSMINTTRRHGVKRNHSSRRSDLRAGRRAHHRALADHRGRGHLLRGLPAA